MGQNKPVTGFNEITSLADDDWLHAVHNNVDKKIKAKFVKSSGVGGNETIIEFTGAWPGNQTLQDARNLLYFINASNSTVKTIYLNATPQEGDTTVIKDKKGDAATYNVTIMPTGGTIDGAASIVLNRNNQSYTLKYVGGMWNII